MAETDISRRDKQLSRAIEDLYVAFSAYPRPTDLDASPVHDGEAIFEALTSAPLRMLGVGALSIYAGSALTTIGDVKAYKHFLPRILELALSVHGEHGLAPELIASKLNYGGWVEWSDGERAALKNFFGAAWERARLRHTDEEVAEDWLCGMLMLGVDISSYLENWLHEPSPETVLQLALFITLSDDLPDQEGWWSEVSLRTRHEMIEWFCSAKVLNTLGESIDRISPSDRWLLLHAWVSVKKLARISGQERVVLH